jgi:hypothetical protein
MSYVDRNLLPGEAILFRTQHHWTIQKGAFIFAILACAFGVTMLGAWWYTPEDQRTFTATPGTLGLVLGLIVGIWAQISVGLAEFAVTSQRVLCRTPLRFFDLFLYQVQQVSVSKSPVADYGSILITAAGVMEGFSHVIRVEQFAAVIEQQVALMHQRTGSAAAAIPPG